MGLARMKGWSRANIYENIQQNGYGYHECNSSQPRNPNFFRCKRCKQMLPINQTAPGYKYVCVNCREKHKTQMYKRRHQYIKTKPAQYLADRLRSRMWEAMTKGTSRYQGCFRHLPYTPEELKDHLLTTLPKGYLWEDYLKGKLHIDHIRPIVSFGYPMPTDPDFLTCWGPGNLQLLPAHENQIKGTTVPTT